ncbi:MAG: GTPase Era [Bacteroidia bacterium]|nr:GTPase Era [Bacteroidia bacterium]MDW8302690.1 GTPase Era [Bacteroidia bacterium]
MTFKSGFVTIVGEPNAGKSTLLNQLLGQKLCIVTPKVQTTRHRILGIYTSDTCQIIFSDTPGILEPKYELHKAMLNSIYDALSDAEAILWLIDGQTLKINQNIQDKVKKSRKPCLLLLNKIDLFNPEIIEKKVETLHQLLPEYEILPISALMGLHTEFIIRKLEKILPEGPLYYDADQLSDRNERFFVSEIIREKIFLRYAQEIPYSVQVVVNSFQYNEKSQKTHIQADIIVMRESQKKIIIGEGGKAIKRIGIIARQEIEKFLQTPVHLSLYVKVQPDWRDKKRLLKEYGYTVE